MENADSKHQEPQKRRERRIDDPTDERYTMGASEVAKLLDVSRETVHNLTKSGVLSYVQRARGKRFFKFFNPEEVRKHAKERGIKTV